MNLALHQLRLEIRRGRVALLLYGLVLVGNFAVVRGWIGMPELEDDRHWLSPGLLSMLLLIAFWVAFAQVVIACVVADSPARRDRFLATRPMTGGALFGGKALFLLMAAVLPAVVLEVVSLAVAGAPAGIVALGGFERFLLAALVAAGLAAFAAHWPSMSATLIAVAVCCGGAMLLGRIVLSLWVMVVGRGNGPIQDPSFLTALQAVLVMTAALGVTAWWKSRHGMKLPVLIPAFAAIFVAGLFVSFRSPFRTVGFRGGEQAALDAIDVAEAIRIAGHRESSNARKEGSAELYFNCAVQPVVSGLPSDWELRWRNSAERWTVEGAVVKDAARNRKAIGRNHISSGRESLSGALIDVIQETIGKPALFLASDHDVFQSTSLSAGTLHYTPDDFPAGATARLESEIAADAFRWRLHADLPVKVGAAENGWEIAGMNRVNGNVEIHVMEQGFALQTAGDPAFRTTSQRWRQQYRYALYLPSRELVWMGQSNRENEVPVISAAQRMFGTIEFEEYYESGTRRAAINFDEARLLIVRADFLGRLVIDWKSPELVLHTEPSEGVGSRRASRSQQELSSAEFARWFRDWEKTDPGEDPAAVHRHLEELLGKAEQTERIIQSPMEPAIIYASGFVPKHLDWMLEKLPANSARAGWFLVAAITQGAEERQRGQITAAIPRRDSLTRVALERGWLDEAPASAAELLTNQGSNLRYFIASLVAQDDPEVDRQLRDFFRRNPSPWTYNTLRQFPRLADEVEAIARETWSPGRLVVTRHGIDPRLQVALSQGRKEALEEFYQLLRYRGAAGGHWQGVSSIPEYLRLPKELRQHRHNNEKIMAWALRLAPSDFTWDPVFRQFVPVAANETI